MRITGVDLSFESTGISRLVLGGQAAPIVALVTTKWRTPLTRNDQYERLNQVADRVLAWCRGADLVAVEGPSFGSQASRQHQSGGLWYKVTDALWHEAIPFVVISPSQVKQYALGKGSGAGTDKDFVLAAVVRRYPMVPVNSNDEADALVLSAMCADYYGCPIAPVPAAHRKAFDKVEWVPREELGLAS